MNSKTSYGVVRNKRTFTYAAVASLMIVTMLLAQLYTYEDFAVVLSAILPSSDNRMLTVLAGTIVFAELFTLPYLLGMFVSKLMRIISALVGFGVAGFWLFVSFTNAHASNSGLFSTSIELPGGLLAAVWSIVLFSLVCNVIFSDSRFRHATS